MIASWFTGYGRVGLRVLSGDVKLNNCSAREVRCRLAGNHASYSSETGGLCILPSHPSSLCRRGVHDERWLEAPPAPNEVII